MGSFKAGSQSFIYLVSPFSQQMGLPHSVAPKRVTEDDLFNSFWLSMPASGERSLGSFCCCCIIIVVPIPPSPSPYSRPTHPNHIPTFNPTPPLCPCPWILYTCSFPFFAPLWPSPLPSGYCQCIPYFHVSVYILLSCLFCWLGFTYRWNHMVFVFHCLAYFT